MFCFVLSLKNSLILGEEDFNVKNNDASAMIRDKGNQLYQKKQFKVIKRSHFKIKARKNRNNQKDPLIYLWRFN